LIDSTIFFHGLIKLSGGPTTLFSKNVRPKFKSL